MRGGGAVWLCAEIEPNKRHIVSAVTKSENDFTMLSITKRGSFPAGRRVPIRFARLQSITAVTVFILL